MAALVAFVGKVLTNRDPRRQTRDLPKALDKISGHKDSLVWAASGDPEVERQELHVLTMTLIDGYKLLARAPSQ